MTETRTERLSLAVLIDADNASARIAAGLFEEIAGLGDANVRRIYGDFSKPNLNGWTEVLARHAINVRQNFAYTSKKNSTDMELVIDAMDLLHGGRIDGVCLVSSDSDFTGLAKRIREQGLQVYGFGEHKTPESLRQACHRFIYTENLGANTAASPAVSAASPLVPQDEAKVRLENAVLKIDPEGGWVHMGRLGAEIRATHPDFDERSYGFRKLSDLITATGAFEVDQRKDGGWLVRPKPPAASKAKNPA